VCICGPEDQSAEDISAHTHNNLRIVDTTRGLRHSHAYCDRSIMHRSLPSHNIRVAGTNVSPLAVCTSRRHGAVHERSQSHNPNLLNSCRCCAQASSLMSRVSLRTTARGTLQQAGRRRGRGTPDRDDVRVEAFSEVHTSLGEAAQEQQVLLPWVGATHSPCSSTTGHHSFLLVGSIDLRRILSSPSVRLPNDWAPPVSIFPPASDEGLSDELSGESPFTSQSTWSLNLI